MLAMNGTKVRINASKRKAMSFKYLQLEERRPQEEIGSICDQVHQVDEAEDTRYGIDCRGNELPDELQHRNGGWRRSAPF